MPEENPSQNQKRQIAYKIQIKDILEGSYVKGEGWTPNYIVLPNQKQISRVNVVGVMVDQPVTETNYQKTTLDDGSGNISLRTFEDTTLLANFNIGDFVAVIGRIREFGNERYIAPEIVKKIEDKAWIELRKIELATKTEEPIIEIKTEEVKEEKIVDDNDVFSIVKELDGGEGADITQVIERSKNPEAEKVVNNMIKIGELFEICPGKIKVLE